YKLNVFKHTEPEKQAQYVWQFYPYGPHPFCKGWGYDRGIRYDNGPHLRSNFFRAPYTVEASRAATAGRDGDGDLEGAQLAGARWPGTARAARRNYGGAGNRTRGRVYSRSRGSVPESCARRGGGRTQKLLLRHRHLHLGQIV